MLKRKLVLMFFLSFLLSFNNFNCAELRGAIIYYPEKEKRESVLDFRAFVDIHEACFYPESATLVPLDAYPCLAFFHDRMKSSIQKAKALVFDRADISNEAKQRVADLKFLFQDDLCATAFGLSFDPSNFLITGIHVSWTWYINYISWDDKVIFEKLSIFGLLQIFAHVVYEDIFPALQAWSRDELDNYFNNFAEKNERALFFALELMRDNNVAHRFFEYENPISLPSEETKVVLDDIIFSPQSNLRPFVDPRLNNLSSSLIEWWKARKIKTKSSLVRNYGLTKKLIIKSGKTIATKNSGLEKFFNDTWSCIGSRYMPSFKLSQRVSKAEYFLMLFEWRAQSFCDDSMCDISSSAIALDKKAFLSLAMKDAKEMIISRADISSDAKKKVCDAELLISSRKSKACLGPCYFSEKMEIPGIYVASWLVDLIDPLSEKHQWFFRFALLCKLAPIVLENLSEDMSQKNNLNESTLESFLYLQKRAFYFSIEVSGCKRVAHDFCLIESHFLDAMQAERIIRDFDFTREEKSLSSFLKKERCWSPKGYSECKFCGSQASMKVKLDWCQDYDIKETIDLKCGEIKKL